MSVRWFSLLAQEVGLSIEIPFWLRHVHSQRFQGLADAVAASCTTRDDISFAFAAAQHHGVSTRLLDWTRRPLVAAFFAAEPPIGGADDADDSLAVWALHNQILEVDTHIRKRAVPNYQLPFLHAQSGLFTEMSDIRLYLEFGHWPTISELVQDMHKPDDSDLRSKVSLRCWTLDRSERKTLLKMLWLESVSRAHLMPTFSHVAEDITRSTRPSTV